MKTLEEKIEFVRNNVNFRDFMKDFMIAPKRKYRSTDKYRAICPTCQSNTMLVDIQKKFYHCFNCGNGGNAIGHYMDWVKGYKKLPEPTIEETVDFLMKYCDTPK